jgi:hypothetical protein
VKSLEGSAIILKVITAVMAAALRFMRWPIRPLHDPRTVRAVGRSSRRLFLQLIDQGRTQEEILKFFPVSNFRLQSHHERSFVPEMNQRSRTAQGRPHNRILLVRLLPVWLGVGQGSARQHRNGRDDVPFVHDTSILFIPSERS